MTMRHANYPALWTVEHVAGESEVLDRVTIGAYLWKQRRARVRQARERKPRHAPARLRRIRQRRSTTACSTSRPARSSMRSSVSGSASTTSACARRHRTATREPVYARAHTGRAWSSHRGAAFRRQKTLSARLSALPVRAAARCVVSNAPVLRLLARSRVRSS